MSSEATYAPPPAPPPNHMHTSYMPPPGPPPNHCQSYPSLLPAAFPLLSPTQVHSLSTQGFTTFPISERPALQDAAHKLFDVSLAFFAQSQPDKLKFQVRDANAQGSEEGWSRVIGEKELLTLRRGGRTCPPSVQVRGRVLWEECGTLMQEVIRGVEQSLAMPSHSLDDIVNPECTMPGDDADRLETLLRMFRYERRSEADDNAAPHKAETDGKGRLVAEPHRDLGVLSLVIGASPGLEVLDSALGRWIPIEEPPYAGPGLTATLLVGETLTRLTNGRYASGRHRVFVPSVSSFSTGPDSESQYRYSLVFALRPHAKAIIYTNTLTTPITGVFRNPMEGVCARELFGAIARSHWNVNTGHKEREAQRLRLEASKPSSMSNNCPGDPKRRVEEEHRGRQKMEQPGKTEQSLSWQLTRKKTRWSLPIFKSRPVPPDDEPQPRNRLAIFQRVSRH